MYSRRAMVALIGLLCLLLSGCQPLVANPAPAPESLGFEAVPPPTNAAAALLPSPNPEASSILFVSGEECLWLPAGDASVADVVVTYYCGDDELGNAIVLGALASVQGQSFQTNRMALGATDSGLEVLSSMPLPFNIQQVALADGTQCVNAGEGTNEIVGDQRVSFNCSATNAQPVSEGRTVLLDGLNAHDDGLFSIDSGLLRGTGSVETVENVTQASVIQLVAQSLTVSVTEADNGKTIYIAPAQMLEVTLPGNPTTGYSWQVSADSTAPLSQAGEPEFVADSDAVGAGGVQILRFDVAGAGSGELLLDYARPFEEGADPVETFSLQVIVVLTPAENGSSVAIQQGQTLGVALPGNPTTGYTWQTVDNDGAILAQTSDPVTMASSTRLGAGGIQMFTFEGVAAGEMSLDMVYPRPWETDTVSANSFSIDVTVE